MNVYSSVYITIMKDFTVIAIPLTDIQIKEHLSLTIGMAHFTCRYPSVYLNNVLASFLCLPLDFLDEVSECVIGHPSTPKSFHAFKVQVFKVADIKVSDKFKCEFPMMVFALSIDFQMHTCQIFSCAVAIVTAFLLPRQRMTCTLDPFRSRFIELWRLIFRAIRTDKQVLEPEVKPCCLTSLRCGFKSFFICCERDIPIAYYVFLDGNSFDRTFNRSTISEAIPSSIDTDFRNRTSMCLVNGFYFDLATIKRHGFVFVSTSEFWRTFRSFSKEVLPAPIYTLDTLLQHPRIGNSQCEYLSSRFSFVRCLIITNALGRL